MPVYESIKNTDNKIVISAQNKDSVVFGWDEVLNALAAKVSGKVTLTPGLFHRFWGEEGKGTVLVREVSMCNDANDNCFYDPAGRFPVIEEDEAPLYLLCNEYPT